MLADQHGAALSGAAAPALDAYEAALRAFNIYRGDPVALADQAIDAAPDFAMAHILKAYLFGLATEPEATAEAKRTLDRVSALALTDREASHVAALRHLLANNWTDAAVALDQHSIRHPHDLLALQAGHLMDFYRANARDLRDRVARALPHWSENRPGYSILLGMYAFGLEEAGDYTRAETMGREAIARDPLDCWAHHAVAHVMEMQGRAEDGVGWMQAREPHWSGDDNFFQVHNWWHKALYHLDLEQTEAVMALYDGPIRSGRSAVALDLVDASALLWRAGMSGCDVGDRWEEVADAWSAHADGALYPFNDWHASMAYLGAGRTRAVDALLARYDADGETAAAPNETAVWARRFGRPLIAGFKAFAEGRYAEAVATLHPARAVVNAFGGSHAQRDVIDWTLTEAAIRSGDRAAAEAFAQERVALKPHSPINRGFLRRAQAA